MKNVKATTTTKPLTSWYFTFEKKKKYHESPSIGLKCSIWYTFLLYIHGWQYWTIYNSGQYLSYIKCRLCNIFYGVDPIIVVFKFNVQATLVSAYMFMCVNNNHSTILYTVNTLTEKRMKKKIHINILYSDCKIAFVTGTMQFW